METGPAKAVANRVAALAMKRSASISPAIGQRHIAG